MSAFLTIAYMDTDGDAVEIPLNINAVSSPTLSLRRNASSEFNFVNGGADPAIESDIPFEGQVCVYMGRVGNPNAYSGGVRIFSGRRKNFRGYGRGGSRDTQIGIADAFYDLATIVFQHYWLVLANGAPAPAPQYFARINLFQNIQAGPNAPWGYMTADQQILQILQFAQMAGALIQPGKIDPVWNMPLYPVRAVSCLEALQICVRSIPDAVLWIDYSTNDAQGKPLPTFNVTQRPNCKPITLPYAYTDNTGRTHEVIDVTERNDLVPTVIQFQYQRTDQVGEDAFLVVGNDTYPPNVPTTALRAQVVPIDLRGAVTTFATGFVTSTAMDVTSLAFWKDKKPDLASVAINNLALLSPNVNDGTPNGITVVDTNGNPVNLAQYPYEMVDGSVCAFMFDANNNPIQAIECVATAFFTYDRFTTQVNQSSYTGGAIPKTGPKTSSTNGEQVSVRFKVTNSPPNPASLPGQPPLPTNYKTVAKNEQPETVPAGLAQNIYNSLAQLQYELNYEMVEANVSQILGPQNTINLAGPGCKPAWNGMNAVIESADIDFFNGRQSIRCGPFAHLTNKEFFDILMMWRVRLVYDNPNLRNTGVDTRASGVQMPQSNPKQNTSEATNPPLTFHAITATPDKDGNQFAIQHDAANQTVTLGTLDKNSTIRPDMPQLLIDLDMLNDPALFEAGQPVMIKLVREKFLLPDCATWNHAWFLKSPNYPGQ